jgi:hypothetical protein
MSDRAQLARQMIEASESRVWQKVILPYLERERNLQIENMASQTDAMQLMRYAGAAQALGSLMRMGDQARLVLKQEMNTPVDKTIES